MQDRLPLLLIFLLVSLHACQVDDDNIVPNTVLFTNGGYCCLEGGEYQLHPSSFDSLAYAIGTEQSFVNENNEITTLSVTGTTSVIGPTTAYQGYSPIGLDDDSDIDSIGYWVIAETFSVTLSNDDYRFEIKLANAFAQVAQGGFDSVDLLTVRDAANTQEQLKTIVIRNAVSFNPRFTSINASNERLAEVTINGQNYCNVIRNVDAPTSIHYSFGKGIVAFTDPTSGQIWSLLE